MTRTEFIIFLSNFRQDLKDNPDKWENKNLSDFLEAMSAYTEDIQGYYDNMNLSINADEPSWENFMNILKGASIYE
ncbi:hypothetical protein [uncultured Imperialibacter sp.]|uniref:DUF7660 family protein n=1 Tax=uncultured Imperialibacter sp. TaxID=1672639 RepID=UPI0030DBB84C|tara:strand:- start:56814 stop:57041 length:228 start_codon:yes stop_codon:yes gene_type:complete